MTTPFAIALVLLLFCVPPLLSGGLLLRERLRTRRLRREAAETAARERMSERLRIARDMHDSLGRRLSLIAAQVATLTAAADGAQKERLALLSRTVSSAGGELHSTVSRLRSDEDPGAPRLAQLTQLTAEVSGAGVPVSVTTVGAQRPLPPEVEAAAYRTVEEGLTNVVKHAPGTPAQVCLTWEEDALVISVSNCSPRPRPNSAGNGLAGLRERVEAAGGLIHREVVEGRHRLSAMFPDAAPRHRQASVLGRRVGLALVLALCWVLPLLTVAGRA